MHLTASPHHTASKPCHTLLTPAAVPAFVCTHSETHTHTRSDAPSYTLRWHYKFSVFIHRCTHDRTQLTIQSLFLAYMAHTWQPNQRGESAFSLSLCLYMSQRAKWDYCNPAWPQDRGNPNGVYFISSLHYFYPFLLFLLFGFSHFTPSFFHVPCPLYFALLPMLLPFYTFHIFIYKHTLKKKKVQLLVILAKELTVDFGLETLFSNILFSVSLFRWHRAKGWYSYVCSTNRLWTPETVCHPARLVWYYTHAQSGS